MIAAEAYTARFDVVEALFRPVAGRFRPAAAAEHRSLLLTWEPRPQA